MQIQIYPEFGVCEHVLGLTHREVAELSGTRANEKGINAPFTRTLKKNSRSIFIWKTTILLVFLVFKPTLHLQTGCRTFSNCFSQETGWLRPFLPAYSGVCPVQTHVWCRERIFLPLWFQFRVQRDASSMFATACKFALFASLQNIHKLGRGFRKKF